VGQVISIRRIRSGEGKLFREIRLASLRESPSAFSSTYESAIARSEESWSDQADSTAAGTERCTFLAFSNKSPVGIAAIYRNGIHKEVGELVQVWISPEFRGSGVACSLMETVLRWCEESGIRKIFAKINLGNDRALKFYRKFGFDFTPSTAGSFPSSLVLVRENQNSV
jgi:ribosomal protein S18 acetylase RimI-like enzyme